MAELVENFEKRLLPKMNMILDQNVAILTILENCKATISDLREKMNSIETKIIQRKITKSQTTMHGNDGMQAELKGLQIQIDDRYNSYQDFNCKRELLPLRSFDTQNSWNTYSNSNSNYSVANTIQRGGNSMIQNDAIVSQSNLHQTPNTPILQDKIRSSFPLPESFMYGDCKAISSGHPFASCVIPVNCNLNQDPGFPLGIDGESTVFAVDKVPVETPTKLPRDFKLENDESPTVDVNNENIWDHLDTHLTDYYDSEESSVSNLNSSSSDSISVTSIDREYKYVPQRKV